MKSAGGLGHNNNLSQQNKTKNKTKTLCKPNKKEASSLPKLAIKLFLWFECEMRQALWSHFPFIV